MERFTPMKVQIESVRICCAEVTCKSENTKVLPLTRENNKLKEVLVYCLECNNCERCDYEEYLKDVGLSK
jgi:hypothetical protein